LLDSLLQERGVFQLRSVLRRGKKFEKVLKGRFYFRMPRIMDLLSLLAVKAPLGGSKNLSPLAVMEVEEERQQQQSRVISEQSDFLHHGGGETRPMQAVRLPCQGEN